MAYRGVAYSGLFFHLLCGFAGATDSLEGKVKRVVSGDTLEVVDAQGKLYSFRFIGADAPERSQTGFTDSKKSLSKRALGKTVSVEWIPDTLCPPQGGECSRLGRVLLRGEDLALRQIQKGWAWLDPRQVQHQSTTDKPLYQDAQYQARLKGFGIWSRPNPVPPWEFALRAKRAPKSAKKK